MSGIKGEKKKETEDTQTEQTTAHSPQPTNTVRVQLPHTLTASKHPKHIMALLGSVCFSHRCQQTVTFI